MCNRPLTKQAAPGLMIGPVCAEKRGLLPVEKPKRSYVGVIPRTYHRKPDETTGDLFRALEVANG